MRNYAGDKNMSKPKKIEKKNGVTGRQNLLKTFTVDFTSDHGIRYKGQFTTSKLTIADLASLGVRKAQLNGGMHHDVDNPGMGVDVQTDDFNSMIAHLDMSLKEWPDWWDLNQITDGDLLALVFEEVVSHENSFLRRKRPTTEPEGLEQSDADGSSEAAGQSDSQGSDNDRVSSAVVDEEVQDALEP